MAKKGGIQLNFLFTARQQITQTFKQVANNFEDINRKGQEMREGFEDMNTQLQKIATVAQKGFQMMTGFIQDTIDTGAQFDFIMAQITGTIKGLGKETPKFNENMGELKDTIFQLSITAGESTAKIAKAAALIIQTGKSIEDTIDLLGVSVQLLTVEGQDFERTAGILIDTMTSLNMTVEEASELVDVFAAVSLATGIQEIDTAARAIGKSSHAMNEFGVSIRDAGAFLALLSKAFVVSAGGIEAFTLVGNAMENMMLKFGESGLLTDDVLTKLRTKLGAGHEEAGKLEAVFRTLRGSLGGLEGEELNGAIMAFGGAIGLSEDGLTGLRKIVMMNNDEFDEMTRIMKQANIAQVNFQEIAGSVQRRLGALQSVMEQMKISFFIGMIEPLTPALLDFFTVIGGEDGQRANKIIQEIGKGFGETLAPFASKAVDVLDRLLTMLENMGPEGQRMIGVLMALSIAFLGVLMNIRMLVPIFKILQGFMGGGAAAGGMFAKVFNNVAKVFGIAGSSVKIFTNGMKMLGKAFIPLGVIISLFDMFGTLLKEGEKSWEDWVKIALDGAQAVLLIASLIPGVHQPFTILASIILGLINGFDLWKDAIVQVAAALDSIGLGGVMEWAKNTFDLDWGDLPNKQEAGNNTNGNGNGNSTHIVVEHTEDVSVRFDRMKQNDSFANET